MMPQKKPDDPIALHIGRTAKRLMDDIIGGEDLAGVGQVEASFTFGVASGDWEIVVRRPTPSDADPGR